MQFHNISKQDTRTYHFPNGKTLLINKPGELHISKEGVHRVCTQDGNLYLINPAQSWYVVMKSKEHKLTFDE